MKKTYFLYLVLFLAVLVFVMVMVGCIECFFDVSSLLMVLLCTIFLLKTNYSFKEIGRYFSCAFDKHVPWIPDLKNGIIFFRKMQVYLLLSGGIGAVMGLVAMLALIEDPEKIGASMALVLITVLYGIFFTMAVAIPFKTALERKLVKMEETVSE